MQIINIIANADRLSFKCQSINVSLQNVDNIVLLEEKLY